jgi:hypothetical protein
VTTQSGGRKAINGMLIGDNNKIDGKTPKLLKTTLN